MLRAGDEILKILGMIRFLASRGGEKTRSQAARSARLSPSAGCGGKPWDRRASALADSGLKPSGDAGGAKNPDILVDVVNLNTPVDVDRSQSITETCEVKHATVAPKRKRIVLIGTVDRGDIDLRNLGRDDVTFPPPEPL